MRFLGAGLREVVVLCSSAQAMEPHQGDLPFAGARSGPARVICGLSGGVDSPVAAGLIHEAIADRLTCALDLRSHFLTKLIRRLNLRLDALNAQPIARVEVRCIRAEAASPYFWLHWRLKKTNPAIPGSFSIKAL
jgi:hypothetical protein